MDDLISREETLKAMDTWDKFGYDTYGRLFPLRSQDELHLYVPYVHYADMVNAVKGMPSAQRTGHWERIFTCELHTVKCWNVFRCSECGSIKQIDANDYNWNYCPVCGSRNGGDNDG